MRFFSTSTPIVTERRQCGSRILVEILQEEEEDGRKREKLTKINKVPRFSFPVCIDRKEYGNNSRLGSTVST